jgi:hypothetical protein
LQRCLAYDHVGLMLLVFCIRSLLPACAFEASYPIVRVTKPSYKVCMILTDGQDADNVRSCCNYSLDQTCLYSLGLLQGGSDYSLLMCDKRRRNGIPPKFCWTQSLGAQTSFCQTASYEHNMYKCTSPSILDPDAFYVVLLQGLASNRHGLFLRYDGQAEFSPSGPVWPGHIPDVDVP